MEEYGITYDHNRYHPKEENLEKTGPIPEGDRDTEETRDTLSDMWIPQRLCDR